MSRSTDEQASVGQRKNMEQGTISRSNDLQTSVGLHEDMEQGDMSGQPHQSMDIQLHEGVRELLESIPDETEETEYQHMYALPGEVIREILESTQEEKAATTAGALPQISQLKRAQTLWQERECNCAMATEELGSLAGLLRKSLEPRRAAVAAKDEANFAKAAYTRAIRELEVYSQVDPSARTELEQDCMRYHDLLRGTQQPATWNTPFHDLENAYQDMNSVMQKLADVNYPDRFRGMWIHFASVFPLRLTYRALRNNDMGGELRAILDPKRLGPTHFRSTQGQDTARASSSSSGTGTLGVGLANPPSTRVSSEKPVVHVCWYTGFLFSKTQIKATHHHSINASNDITVPALFTSFPLSAVTPSASPVD
ncbi:hypothetical protein BGZ67_008436 [Mortierella alpina]|nr:hypothetical protein BGZ67_008436 [Mortierella alpina]